MNLKGPLANDVGLFEPVLGKAPPSWPWALPHFYAVNVALESGDVVVGVTADPSGAYQEERNYRTDRGRFEVVGFWRGSFSVVHAQAFDSIEQARREARDSFEQLAVRFFMEGGNIKGENPTVVVSGEWPARWRIERLQDLGVLSAHLWEVACGNGGQDAANDFRALIHLAAPATEQVLVYLHALEAANKSLPRFLTPPSIEALSEGLRAARAWLKW